MSGDNDRRISAGTVREDILDLPGTVHVARQRDSGSGSGKSVSSDVRRKPQETVRI